PGVLRLEERPVLVRLALRIARIAALGTLERRRQDLLHDAGDPRPELVPRPLVPQRQRALGQDRPGVELGGHPVEGDAYLAVAVPDRPADRDRPAIARQERRVEVDHAEPWNLERLGRQLPGEAGAEGKIRLEHAE